MHRSTVTKPGLFMFWMYDLSTEGSSRKEMLDWGQILKGLKKNLTTEINHWSSLCGISHKMMMLNRNAKENARDDWKASQDDTHSTRL